MTCDVVDIWLIRSDLPAPVLADLSAVLDDAERSRADGFGHALHRRRFIAVHGAARVIIGQHLGVPPARIRWRRGPHGKPEVAAPPEPASPPAAGSPFADTPARAGVHISLSHSGELAALAITGWRRVGVDVQQFPAGGYAVRVAQRFYSPAEARYIATAGPAAQLSRFVALWARKEACVKVTGGRLMEGMKLPVGESGRVVVRDPGGPLPGPYLVRNLRVPRGFRAAVALEGADPYQVSQHIWPPPNPGPPPGMLPIGDRG